jgi:uncharacterized protein with FMN-binding domain
VAVGTVVGLASVLGFHTSPVKISLGAVTGAATPSAPTKQSTTTTSRARTTTTRSGSSTNPSRTTPSATSAPATTTTVAPPATSGVRTANGPVVNYYYGQLSVKVTASGKKITAVTIASISDGGNPRSIQIDQYAIPYLEPEALAAQSYHIQSVSGASYTSAGFQMSLQYALKKLGI